MTARRSAQASPYLPRPCSESDRYNQSRSGSLTQSPSVLEEGRLGICGYLDLLTNYTNLLFNN
ncbi:MAG TPA: hypothetical protein VGC75_04995 [Candidatus Nitrosocosmicus sp.]